jgi:broad specificity phosphatase PhoE
VYATEYRRAQETAAPIADALNLPINTYDASNTKAVLRTILANHKGKIILVVGHSNTVPLLIANLGASKKVPPIGEDEYDNIYVVTIPWFGKTKTIRLRFGEPYVAAASQ